MLLYEQAKDLTTSIASSRASVRTACKMSLSMAGEKTRFALKDGNLLFHHLQLLHILDECVFYICTHKTMTYSDLGLSNIDSKLRAPHLRENIRATKS